MKKHGSKTLFLSSFVLFVLVALAGLAVVAVRAETPGQSRGKKQAAALWRADDGLRGVRESEHRFGRRGA
jgi:hypothetical protein